MRTLPPRTTLAIVVSFTTVGMLAACGGDDSTTVDSSVAPATTITEGANPCDGASGSLTVYSGRSEKLVADLYAQFTSDTASK